MPRPREVPSPAFPLERIKQLVRTKRFVMTQSAERGMQGLGLTIHDVIEYVCLLEGDDLDKTVPSHDNPDTFLDVYEGKFREPDGTDLDLYIKVQLLPSNGSETVNIISFKRWGAP